MYYVLAAAVLMLGAAIDDVFDGQVYDLWTVLLVAVAVLSGGVGAVQVWFALNFAVFGYFLSVEEVWSMGDTLLFAAGSLYLDGFGMVAVYLASVVVVGTVYSFVWDEYIDRDGGVRFVPVLTAAFVVAVLFV